MRQEKLEVIRRHKRGLGLGAMVVCGPTTIAAHAVTMDDVVTSCSPCHGLIVNQVVVSDGPGSLGFPVEVGVRSQAYWVRTVNDMIRSGAEVADVDGTAAYLAGLGAQAATPTPTPSPTPTLAPPACTGDCDSSSAVTVNELVTLVNIALGNTPLSTCTAGDADGSGDITINEVIAATNNALNGCPA